MNEREDPSDDTLAALLALFQWDAPLAEPADGGDREEKIADAS